MSTEQHKAHIRRALDHFNRGDLEAFLQEYPDSFKLAADCDSNSLPVRSADAGRGPGSELFVDVVPPYRIALEDWTPPGADRPNAVRFPASPAASRGRYWVRLLSSCPFP